MINLLSNILTNIPSFVIKPFNIFSKYTSNLNNQNYSTDKLGTKNSFIFFTSILGFFSKTASNLLSSQKINYLGLHIASAARWIKIRVSYTLNSWVYTTNHKRIAINYFNFVLVSGTAGMSLATVIRMEFAYPGVGILAGDSIQYLSIATAHGVIMVFFMIMPAIFGAFGNFLLPTQLGVHDVAFPRLNSAAFWFLPGGLIMLCQLVCVDRRYQRMNCFNIRELQGILKRKFFTDLVNTSDSHKASESTLISMRHKNNMSNILTYDQSLFYNFDLTNTSKFKIFSFEPGKVYTYSTITSNLENTFSNFTKSSPLSFTNYTNNLFEILADLRNFFHLPNAVTVSTILTSPIYIKSVFLNTLYIHMPNYTSNPITTFTTNQITTRVYNSSTVNYSTMKTFTPSTFAENSSS